MDWAEASELIKRYESAGGQNIKNPTSSAGGPWQMIDRTWRGAAPGVGVDIRQYPTALSAPVGLQEQVAKSLYQRGGFSDWAPYNPKLASAIGWQGKTSTYDSELGRDVPYVRISKAPQEELPPLLFLDGLLGGSKPGPDEGGSAAAAPNPLAFLDSLLGPQGGQQASEVPPGGTQQAEPIHAPLTAPMPVASEFQQPLEAQPIRPVGPQPASDENLAAARRINEGITAAPVPGNVKQYMQRGPAMDEGETIGPPMRFETGIPPEDQTDTAAGAPNVRRQFENIQYRSSEALLDKLLGAVNPIGSAQAAETPAPPARSALPAPQTGLQRYLATSAEALSEAPAGIAKGAGQFLDTLLGLGERVGLGMAAGETGQPMPEAKIPVAPGLRALGGFADFATGGLLSPLGIGGQAAATTTRAVGREAEMGVPGALADVRGGARAEPPTIGGLPGGGSRPPPRPPKPPEPPGTAAPLLDPPIPGEGMKQIATRIDDALHRVLGGNTADKIEMSKWYRGIPKQFKDEKLRAFMADDIERRMIDPEAALDPRTQAFLDLPQVKFMTDEENTVARELAEKLGSDADKADLPTAAQGYVHRIVKRADQREVIGPLDPERARTADVVTGSMTAGRGRSLSTFAPGMQARARRFVLQDETGRRVFNTKTLDDMGYEYGQALPSRDKTWTVKPPTMAEMEANTPVRYHRDYIGNLVSNVLRLRRIKRNADLLGDLKTELNDKGLFHEDRRMIGRDGAVEHWVKTGQRPEELSAEINLPQLKGWTDPKIAAVLNDFWNAGGNELDGFFTKVNRFLVGSLFATPVPHIANVGAHWLTGRGWDWLSIPAYINGAVSGARALNAVWNLTPEYTRMLREGSGLLYGDVRMENFINTLMRKTWTEQLRNPEIWNAYAKSVGLKGVIDLVKAEYRWSRKTLWAASDMMMLQRQFELERKGMLTRQAIFEAERDIPNYRVPSEVLGSRGFAQALKSPNLMNFGRYHYGLSRALGLMVRDMISPKATPRERWEGVGKLTVLGTLGALGYPAMDALLKDLTGNESATVRRAGPLGPVSSAGYLARNAYQKFSGESAPEAIQKLLPGDREWIAMMSPLMTLAPTLEILVEGSRNIDALGRLVIDPRGSLPGMTIQAGEAVANQFMPTKMGMQAMGEGGLPQAAGGLVGLNLPPREPGPMGKTQRMLRGRARSREKRDPVQQKILEGVDYLTGPRTSINGP
jgi:hypothetical protein